MSLSVHALASGSSGNSTLLKHIERGRTTYLLIDAGLTLHGTRKALAHFGVQPDMLAAIVLSHEHSDHSRSAHALARQFNMPIVANERTLGAVIGEKNEVRHMRLATGDRAVIGDLCVETFAVPHDAVDPVGVSISCGDVKVTQITDAGCVTPVMREAVRRSNLLILEANHDVYRLKTGPYPDILKRRVLSDRGHLSNEAAVHLLTDHLLDYGPCSIWLAHLSKVNNLPKLALNYVRATLAFEARCPFSLDVAHRDRPSVSWSPGAKSVQLDLFDLGKL